MASGIGIMLVVEMLLQLIVPIMVGHLMAIALRTKALGVVDPFHGQTGRKLTAHTERCALDDPLAIAGR